MNSNRKKNQVVLSLPLLGKLCQKLLLEFWKKAEKKLDSFASHLRSTWSLTLKKHGNCGNNNASIRSL